VNEPPSDFAAVLREVEDPPGRLLKDALVDFDFGVIGYSPHGVGQHEEASSAGDNAEREERLPNA
jgi:hypothetical protein